MISEETVLSKYILICFILIQFMLSPLVFGQNEDDDEEMRKLRSMGLEEILNTSVLVASQTPLSIREAPGMISVITRKEIENSGARDLMEVLTLHVPGFSFGQSEFGPIGLTLRGIWTFEGKVQLLIDGIEMNEEAYTSILFGHHYLTDIVQRIEIIRGPGSVIYGGYASMGVINIITRDYAEEETNFVSAGFGKMFEKQERISAAFGWGNYFSDLKINLSGYTTNGALSDGKIKAYFPSTPGQLMDIPLGMQNTFLNLTSSYKNFGLNFSFDRYQLNSGIPVNFTTFNLTTTYENQLLPELGVKAKLMLTSQSPWDLKSTSPVLLPSGLIDTSYANTKSFFKVFPSIQFNWQISRNINQLIGFEYKGTKVVSNSIPGYLELPMLFKEIDKISGISAYSQLLFQFEPVNITIGGRYEYTDAFGGAFVPRLAFTKIMDDFHFKLMYSQSYRTPAGRYYSPELEPEKGRHFEIEFGYRIGYKHNFVINLYDYHFTDLITVKRDSLLSATSYSNSSAFGTRGIDFEYKYSDETIQLGINAAYYLLYDNNVKSYIVPLRENVTIGASPFRLNFFCTFNFADWISITPSLSLYSSRIGFTSGTITQTANSLIVENYLENFSPVAIFNLSTTVYDVFLDGLKMNLAIYNFFNQNYEYIQPFLGYNAPLPGRSLTFWMRFNFEF
jgi:outer membrane cobalamin receptor